MQCYQWTKVTGTAVVAVIAASVPVTGVRPAHAATTRENNAVTQITMGQGTEHQRAVEAEVTGLLADGRYVAVIDAVKQEPSPSAFLLNVQGVAYEHMGGFENARLCYEESIKLNPRYSNVYNNLGTVFYARHDNRMAMKMYKKAIKLDSQSASAYKNLGASYFHAAKTQRGVEAFEEAIAIDPDVFDRQGLIMDSDDRGTLAAMNYSLAQLCAKRGKADAAIAYLNRAIADGFVDYGKLKKDDAFAAVRQMPEFPLQSR